MSVNSMTAPTQHTMEGHLLPAPDVILLLAMPVFPARDEDGVARLAYAYWEERLRNRIPGSAEDDWYRAEQDFRSAASQHSFQ